jgi:hypothetical protein
MSRVEIELSDTDAAVEESKRFMGGWRWWLGTLLSYGLLAMGFSWIAAIGCMGVYFFMQRVWAPSPQWLSAMRVSPLAIVPLGFLGWNFLRARRERHTTRARVRATFSDKGLSMDDGHGESFSDAWSDWSGFYVGRWMILLPKIEVPVSARIPTDRMPGDRLAEIRGLLSGHLAELSRRDFRASVRAAKRRAG